MTGVREVTDYLRQFAELEAHWLGSSEALQANIHGFRSDQEAGPGDLAWLSPKYAADERIRSFQGSLLIAPAGVEAQGKPVLQCAKPKLAFIFAVTHFFNELTRIEWTGAESQISPDAQLAPGVVIGSNVTIAEGAVIGPNTVLANCRIERNVSIGANCTIGLPGFGYEKDEDGRYWRFPHTGGVVIEEDVEIGSNTCIDRGSIGNTLIAKGSKVDNLVHVAHNVIIGPHSMIIANSMLGGSVQIEEHGWVAPSASVMNQVHIGRAATIGLGAVVLKDVEDYAIMVGNPARLLRKAEAGS